MFIYSQNQIEEEDEADDELLTVGIEVRELRDDEQSMVIQTSNWTNFPLTNATLTAGTTHVALVPDSGLSSLYGDTRVTVYHETEEIAECMLGDNYLPPAVFGRDADIDIRSRVFDALGLTDNGVSDDNLEYRNQLREVAGLDEAEDPDEATFDSEAERLKKKYKYTELKTMASDAGIENANQKKDDLAEYLVSVDEDY